MILWYTHGRGEALTGIRTVLKEKKTKSLLSQQSQWENYRKNGRKSGHIFSKTDRLQGGEVISGILEPSPIHPTCQLKCGFRIFNCHFISVFFSTPFDAQSKGRPLASLWSQGVVLNREKKRKIPSLRAPCLGYSSLTQKFQPKDCVPSLPQGHQHMAYVSVRIYFGPLLTSFWPNMATVLTNLTTMLTILTRNLAHLFQETTLTILLVQLWTLWLPIKSTTVHTKKILKLAVWTNFEAKKCSSCITSIAKSFAELAKIVVKTGQNKVKKMTKRVVKMVNN